MELHIPPCPTPCVAQNTTWMEFLRSPRGKRWEEIAGIGEKPRKESAGKCGVRMAAMRRGGASPTGHLACPSVTIKAKLQAQNPPWREKWAADGREDTLKNCRIWVFSMADRRIPRAKSAVARGASVPNSRPLRRAWHGVAVTSIGLDTAPLYWTHQYDPKNGASLQIAIGAAMGGAGGDALIPVLHLWIMFAFATNGCEK
jgi:hypothetical protein